MSYQVLARKWRPRSFANLVGQEHVVRALTHALSEQRLHHAYLFTGTRGVGKTTIARILAKSLNCDLGVSATPCGECSACTEIDAGRFVDLLEVDAATNTRVDEMRQLLENAVYAPTRGRYKVYVIDEVHMLSNAAFNAMLKTLEEPPEHVKFILATTDPQKIPVTVLSRCLQFNLKQMSPTAISGHLAFILDAEALVFESEALFLLARAAAGSMRDALSLLDQAIAHGAGRVDAASVRTMLGSVSLDYLLDLLEALLAEDVRGMLAIVDDMAARSLSFNAALQELAHVLTQVQLAQLAPEALAETMPERSRLLGIAARMAPEFVQLLYQIAIYGRQELSLAPDDYAGFVMTVLRMHAFSPMVSEPPASAEVGGSKSTVSEVLRPSASSKAFVGGEATIVSSVAVQQGVDKGLDWHRVLLEMNLSGMARELAQHCEVESFENACLMLRLPPLHRHLQLRPAQDRLQQAFSEWAGYEVVVKISLLEARGDTPAAAAQRARQDLQAKAVAAIEQDNFVRAAIELFDAQLIESSIKPI